MSIDYVESKDDLRRRLPLRGVARAYGIAFSADGYALCPWHGDTNPSLSLYPADDGTERWICYPCRSLGLEPSGGDVFDLIARSEGTTFSDALSRARLLARDAPDPGPAPPARERGVLDASVWEPLLRAASAYAVSAPERLHLLQSVAGFGTGWAEHLRRWGWGLSEDGWALVPYRAPDGTLVGIKLRRRLPDGSKQMLSVPYSRYPHMYGAEQTPYVFADAVVVEGETDAVYADLVLSGHRAQVYALPGAGTVLSDAMLAPLLGRDTDARVLLCMDGDAEGRAAQTRMYGALLERAPVLDVRHVWLPDGQDLRSSGLDADGLYALALSGRDS